MKVMNIMTSCDDRYALFIMPQLAAISVNMPNILVNFYMFHSCVSAADVTAVRAYCGTFRNIKFHEVRVSDEDASALSSLYVVGAGFPGEAYYHMLAHKYTNCDRILYIDAADVIIMGDISEYYYADFEENALIATSFGFLNERAGHEDDPPLFTLRDYEAVTDYDLIYGGVISTGCFVINCDLLRHMRLCVEDLLVVSRALTDILKKEYCGDQALVSAAFAGKVKYFCRKDERGEYLFDSNYRPYNFYFSDARQLSSVYMKGGSLCATASGGAYSPIVVHFGGAFKPWRFKYQDSEYDFMEGMIPPLSDFTPEIKMWPAFAYRELKWWYDIYWKYLEMTPIYEWKYAEARVYGKAMVEFFLKFWVQTAQERLARDV